MKLHRNCIRLTGKLTCRFQKHKPAHYGYDWFIIDTCIAQQTAIRSSHNGLLAHAIVQWSIIYYSFCSDFSKTHSMYYLQHSKFSCISRCQPWIGTQGGITYKTFSLSHKVQLCNGNSTACSSSILLLFVYHIYKGRDIQLLAIVSGLHTTQQSTKTKHLVDSQRVGCKINSSLLSSLLRNHFKMRIYVDEIKSKWLDVDNLIQMQCINFYINLTQRRVVVVSGNEEWKKCFLSTTNTFLYWSKQ